MYGDSILSGKVLLMSKYQFSAYVSSKCLKSSTVSSHRVHTSAYEEDEISTRPVGAM